MNWRITYLNKLIIFASVIWFNLGSHHVPHSGDIPNTLQHTSASSIMFTPYNFHDRDPSRKTAQGVRLELGDETKVRVFGYDYTQDQSKVCMCKPVSRTWANNSLGYDCGKPECVQCQATSSTEISLHRGHDRCLKRIFRWAKNIESSQMHNLDYLFLERTESDSWSCRWQVCQLFSIQ